MALAGKICTGFLLLLVAAGRAPAQAPAAQRGQEALLNRALLLPAWSLGAYQDLWKRIGLKDRPSPKAFATLLREHYGLSASGVPQRRLTHGASEIEKPIHQRHHHELLALPWRLVARSELCGAAQHFARHPGSFRRSRCRRWPFAQAALYVQPRPRHHRGRRHDRVPFGLARARPAHAAVTPRSRLAR